MSDPFANEVIVLLHMDGADGSSTIIDEKGNTVQNFNVTIKKPTTYLGSDATLSATSFQQISTTANVLSIDNNLIDCSSNLTFDMYIAVNNVSENYSLFGCWDGGGQRSFVVYYLNNSITFYISANYSTYVLVLTANLSGYIINNNLFHLEISRSTAGIYRVFVDGHLLANVTNTSNVTTSTVPLLIGGVPKASYEIGGASQHNGDYLPLRGYIEEFRVTRAIRHTADFDLPTRTFLLISPAQLILSDSSGTVLQSKDISGYGSGTFDATFDLSALTWEGNIHVYTTGLYPGLSKITNVTCGGVSFCDEFGPTTWFGQPDTHWVTDSFINTIGETSIESKFTLVPEEATKYFELIMEIVEPT